VLVLLLAHYGLTRRRLPAFFASGAVLSISLFLSFGQAVIVGFVGLYALFWWVQARRRPRWHWLLGGALLFGLGAASFWLWLWLRHGLGFFAVWRTAVGRHLDLGGRSGWFWVLYNLYDFWVAAAGIPILVLWALHTFQAGREAWGRRALWARRRFWSQAGSPHSGWLDLLALSFGVGLLGMDLAGVARGEVARVWAFLLPLPLLVAARRLPRRGLAFLGTLVLLSAQLFVTNIHVRYVGTNLTDPPFPPEIAQAREGWTPWRASWEPGIALEAVDVPEVVSSGETIAVGTTWSASTRIRRPYTVFMHLYDAQGALVAQRDTMPLDGGWPTPCWRPGEPFRDRYILAPSQPLAPGPYRVELGLYWLPTGERLPVQGQGAQPHRTVHLGEVRVEAQ
jgi:hypothetical protein